MKPEELKKQVQVIYPDGKGNHTTTVLELQKKFKEEAPGWRENFFNSLLNEGTAHSRFGEYKLI